MKINLCSSSNIVTINWQSSEHFMQQCKCTAQYFLSLTHWNHLTTYGRHAIFWHINHMTTSGRNATVL
jgi:hypothetical protein